MVNFIFADGTKIRADEVDRIELPDDVADKVLGLMDKMGWCNHDDEKAS
jgi:hypothetical protein